jgi:hypothetical protein
MHNDKLQIAIDTLRNILKTAKDHPCFSGDHFESSDIDGLCEIGGDICDWTVLAITANDALSEIVKNPDGTNAAEPENLKTSVKAAMEELTNASMGGVGDGGPTIEELDEIVARTGNCCAGDCDYHTIQRAWRLLQAGLDEKNPSDGHGG